MKKKEDLDTFYRNLKELVKSEKNTTDEEKKELLFYSMLAMFVYQETGECDFKAVLDFWDKAHDFTSKEEFQKKLKAFLEDAIKEKDISVSKDKVTPPNLTQSDTEQPSDIGESRTAEGRE